MLNLISFLPKFTWLDLFDVAIVAFLFYQLLAVIRGTRAVQILQGIAVLLLVKLASFYLHLATLNWILDYLILGIAVALPIVFQPELRRALEQLGRESVAAAAFTRLKNEDMLRLVDEITWAAVILSQTKTGAIIVIEQETGLEDFIEKGTKVGGEVSSKLLLSIFIPPSPLHDGAVIIRNLKVMAAGCYLPLSDNPWVEKSLGSRHRAAIGITEETDAVVLVVSEQNGEVSLVKDGKLTRNLDETSIRSSLLAHLFTSSTKTAAPLWKVLWKDSESSHAGKTVKNKS